MKKGIIGLVVGVFMVALAGCGEMNKAQLGAIGGAGVGAVVGQAIGHNDGGTLIGVAVGSMLGYIFGNEMDKYDQQMLQRSFENTPLGQTNEWTNPHTGNEWRVTPNKQYEQVRRPRWNPDNRRSGDYRNRRPQHRQRVERRVCREAEIEARIGGKVEKTYTTACRDEYSGRWILQK